MSRSRDQRWRIVGAFADAHTATKAVDALRAAGVAADAITLAGGVAAQSQPLEHEERFIGRLVLIVVAWSLVGTGLGAVIGVVLNALDIGPGGTGGLVIQIASWAIFVHLIGGLWAGYALLTKGESREPVRHLEGGRAVVSVWASRDNADVITSHMRGARATAVATYGADGRLID